MNFRTKLTSVLILLALISSSLALICEYRNIESSVKDSFISRTKNVALAISLLVDPSLMEAFYRSPQKNSKEYLALEKQFRNVLRATSASEILVESIYTLTPKQDDPNHFTVGVDVHSDLKISSQVGMPWALVKNFHLGENLNHPYSPHSFITNQKGIWLNGFAPIKDSSGKYIATVGVSIISSHLLTLLHRVIEYQIIGMLLSLIVAALAAYFLMRHIIIPLKSLSAGVSEVNKGNFAYRIQLKTHDEFYILASSINKMSKALSEKKRLKKGFSHYLTHAVLSNVLTQHVPMKMKGEKKKVTLLFIRFKDFPQKIELFEPEQFFELFNETHLKFLSIVFRNRGTLEKFFSDEILVEFGIPLDDPDQEENALKTAIEITEQTRLINQLFQLKETQQLHVHIGIHTGEAVIGTIGSTYRKEFTVIGESINTVTHITKQGLEGDYTILMSEQVATALKEKYPIKEIGKLTSKESQEAISLYTLKDEI